MSSGDDDYGNPQRAIEHERTLNRMKEERIALLVSALSSKDAEIARLRKAIDDARRFSASDPKNEWARQATLILNAALSSQGKAQ